MDLRPPRDALLWPMHPHSSQQVALLRPADTRRDFYAASEHSEFVHGGYQARRCLYSECRCGGFILLAGA
jgi:hypothetical protein